MKCQFCALRVKDTLRIGCMAGALLLFYYNDFDGLGLPYCMVVGDNVLSIAFEYSNVRAVGCAVATAALVCMI